MFKQKRIIIVYSFIWSRTMKKSVVDRLNKQKWIKTNRIIFVLMIITITYIHSIYKQL